MVTAAITATVAVAAPLPEDDLAGADAVLPAIRPEAIAARMRFLSGAALEGRDTGSRGFDVAARYVAAELEAIGLEPAGADGGWFQPVALRRVEPGPEPVRFELLAADGTATPVDPLHVASAGDLARTAHRFEGATAYVGYGVSAPELGYDDYRDVDVAGRIVLLVSGAPATLPPLEREYFSDSLVKATTAAQRGASGLLVIHSAASEAEFPFAQLVALCADGQRQWLDAAGEAHGAVPALGARLAIDAELASRLFAGSGTTLDEALAATARGEGRSFALPARVRIATATRHEALASENVVGLLRGSDPELRDEYLVLSAHLDHLGHCPAIDGDDVCHGAVDNAGGVATLLEVARALATLEPAPRRSVLFLFVTGEEGNLEGSDAFAESPTVPRGSLVADLNVDTPPGLVCDGRDAAAIGAEHSDLRHDAERAARQAGFRITADPFPEESLFLRNDQFSFALRGVPSLFLFAGADCAERVNAWLDGPYHSPLDDMRQPLDFAAAARFARLELLLAWSVAERADRPRWNAGDFFGERLGGLAGAASPSERSAPLPTKRGGAP